MSSRARRMNVVPLHPDQSDGVARRRTGDPHGARGRASPRHRHCRRLPAVGYGVGDLNRVGGVMLAGGAEAKVVTGLDDLRHTGNTWAAETGATLRDLMDRMGHATTRAAMIYMHRSSGRDRVIA